MVNNLRERDFNINEVGKKIFTLAIISVIIVSILFIIYRENPLLPSCILAISTLALVFVTYYYAYFNKRILKETEINREILFLGSRLENLYSYLKYQKYLLTDNSHNDKLVFENHQFSEFKEFIPQIRKFIFLASEKLFIKLQYWLQLAEILELHYGRNKTELSDYRVKIDELRRVGGEIINQVESDYKDFNIQLFKLINERRSKLSERCSRCKSEIPKLESGQPCPACGYNPSSSQINSL